jgi:glycosyltransferase involved in cell wall biosynthesis
METVDDAGAQGLLKRRLYRWLLSRKHPTLQGILAIGWATENWLIARGANRNTTFPFAYFLSESAAQIACKRCFAPHFRFLFVGQLIKRKRVDRLLDALAAHLSFDFELVIIGDGPARRTLVELGNQLLPNRVRWLGHLPMADIPQEMVNADCLILPSRHDGWGAVASEALIVGTPVICSDACGAAGVVRASGVGGVFPRDKVMTLSSLLGEMLRNGPLEDSERYELKEWAKCIGAEAGAKYLLEILRCTEEYGERPEAPWSRECSENRARSLSND